MSEKQAEELCENHKQDLLKQIHNLEQLSRANEEITRLEERISDAQRRLEQLRETRGQLTVKGDRYSYPAGHEPEEEQVGF